MKKARKDGAIIIMGDFNAKVGQGIDGNTVGVSGLGQRNERRDRMVKFCEKENMIICNTLFKQPPRRFYTWQSPGGSRNQIDYFLVNERYKNAILTCHTFPSAD